MSPDGAIDRYEWMADAGEFRSGMQKGAMLQ